MIVKKPISLDALRTSSATALRSSILSLYIRDTSIRGIDSKVVDAFEATVNELPLDKVIVLGSAVTAVVVAMVLELF